ncbi:MAG: hypothetical protein ACI9OJ_003982 [Myxococcota bacterium]|jgi:hypothetical protein
MSTREVTWSDVEAYEAELRRELPRFEICYKDESPLQRVIGKLVWLFNRSYMTNYTTVMFGRVYFPNRKWAERLGPRPVLLTLRHEAVHLRDMKRFPLIFQLTYLFVFPTVFSMRAIWELRAYRESIRAQGELYGSVQQRDIEFIVERFTGADYLFMFPFAGVIRRDLERVALEAGFPVKSEA